MVTLYNFASAETWSAIRAIAEHAHTPSHVDAPLARRHHAPKSGTYTVRLAPGHTVNVASRQTSRRIRGVFNLAKSMCIALGFEQRERLALLAAERPKVKLVSILTEFAATEGAPHGH